MPSAQLPFDVPGVRGLRLRAFAGDADFPLMAPVANATFAADGMGWIRQPEHIRRDYAEMTGWDPARDMAMAEVDGELAGYARTMDWTTADGTFAQGQVFLVPPRYRGVASLPLLQWLEARQREIARAHPGATAWVHHAFLTEGEHERAQLLRDAGYAPARHFLEMVRPDLDDIPDFPLPPGFEVRPVAPEHLRAIFDAHMEALQGMWGLAPPTPGAVERWTQSRTYQPHLWQIAWHVQSNRVAGQVKPWIDAEQNETRNLRRGYTEFISVGAPWRRQGLARALVVRALRALRDAGMTESELGVDSESPDGAPRLYEACGFRVVKRNAVVRKPVDLQGP